MNDILLCFLRALAAAVWVYSNVYLIQNRKAVAKLFRGYGAYERWKMREWVAGWEDTFNAECKLRNAECRIKNAE